MVDAVLIHGEEDGVLAAIHACHHSVSDEDEKSEKGDEDEDWPCVFPQQIPIVPMDVLPVEYQDEGADACKYPEEDFIDEE